MQSEIPVYMYIAKLSHVYEFQEKISIQNVVGPKMFTKLVFMLGSHTLEFFAWDSKALFHGTSKSWSISDRT